MMTKRLTTFAWASLAMTGIAAAQAPPADSVELSEQQRLRQFSPGGPLTPGVELPRWPAAPNPLDFSAPVTDALLADPPASDWLTWRRTHDGQGFSPLTDIHKENVDQLQLAWSLALPAGPNTATPLVHDGVIYVHSYGDHVQALDAATGDELWHYARELPNDFRPTVKRNIALYRDKIYFGTSDVHVVALSAKTGSVVWDQPITEPNSGFGLSGGPLVVADKVMQGVNGQAPGGAYIVGLDAETGKEAWRFYSIARPGEPGGATWNGLPLDKRTGGSVWTAGSYDAERNLAFFGPAPTYDTGPLRPDRERHGLPPRHGLGGHQAGAPGRDGRLTARKVSAYRAFRTRLRAPSAGLTAPSSPSTSCSPGAPPVFSAVTSATKAGSRRTPTTPSSSSSPTP